MKKTICEVTGTLTILTLLAGCVTPVGPNQAGGTVAGTSACSAGI